MSESISIVNEVIGYKYSNQDLTNEIHLISDLVSEYVEADLVDIDLVVNNKTLVADFYSTELSSSLAVNNTINDLYLSYDVISEDIFNLADLGMIAVQVGYIESSVNLANEIVDSFIETDSLLGNIVNETVIGVKKYIDVNLSSSLTASEIKADGYVEIDNLLESIINKTVVSSSAFSEYHLKNSLVVSESKTDSYVATDNYVESIINIGTITTTAFSEYNLDSGIVNIADLSDFYIESDIIAVQMINNLQATITAFINADLSSKLGISEAFTQSDLIVDNINEVIGLNTLIDHSVEVYSNLDSKTAFIDSLSDYYLDYDTISETTFTNADMGVIDVYRTTLNALIGVDNSLSDGYVEIDNSESDFSLSVDNLSTSEFYSVKLSSSIRNSESLLDVYLTRDTISELLFVDSDLGTEYKITAEINSLINTTDEISDSYIVADSLSLGLGMSVGISRYLTYIKQLNAKLNINETVSDGYITIDNLSETVRVSGTITAIIVPFITLSPPIVSVVQKKYCKEITINIENDNNYTVAVYKDNVLIGSLSPYANNNFILYHSLNGDGGTGGYYETTIKFEYDGYTSSYRLKELISILCFIK